MARVPVAIVGGGPVGLTAAIELARHGIRSLLVEKHRSTTWHPKARNLNTRTMEIIRSWGAKLHDEIAAVNLPRAWTSRITYTRTLAGEELGSMTTAGFSGPGPKVSPEVPLLSSQDVFEPIFRRAAEATGLAELRFDHEATGLVRGGREDDDHAVVAVKDRVNGRDYEIETEWVLAADGSASGIRESLGIGLDGPRGLGHFVNVYFRADLDPWIAHRPALLFWVANGDVRGVFQPLDARGRFLCQIAYDGTPETFASYTPERCLGWIRAATGVPDVQAQILSIGSWSLNAVVAERLVQGRVILVGDAAAQLPPIGGFGVNTGVQGMHNMVWKLALVRDGKADPGLLRTYDVERRAVSATNCQRSLENTMMVARINAAASGDAEGLTPAEAVAASKRYGNFLGMELGYHYDSTAVVPDGTDAPAVEDEVIDYAPSGRPGHRAPHVALERDGVAASTLDLASGPGFAVLAGARGEPWLEATADAARRVDVAIVAHAIGAAGGWCDPAGDFAERYGIGADGAVLVRPDGHVAFRARDASGTVRLASALERIFRAR